MGEIMMRLIHRVRYRVAMRARDEAGFTMIEMVMSIFIFGLVVTGVGVGMSSALNLTRQNRNRSIAANLASQQMDTVRGTDFDTLEQMTHLSQPTTVTPTPTVEGVPYTVVQETKWVYKNATGATAGPCQSPPTAANPLAYIAVRTTVSWADMHGVPPVQSNTVISPPVGVYDQTEGHIRVTVLDAAAQPVSGVVVQAANPVAGVNDTATTGSDGCAFFAYEPVGAYTVTLGPLGSGRVDGQGSASPTQSVTVKSASTSTAQFLFDSAAALTLTLTATSGGTVPTTVPVSLGNTALQPTGVLSYASPTGTTRTIGNLFPYASGFQAWAGGCSDADPQGVNSSGGSYYPGANRAAAIAMTPGSTSSGTVNLPSLKLQYKRSSSSAAYKITATHAVGDTGCPAGETYVLNAALTVTTATTPLIVALPYGTWTITWKNNGSSATGSQTYTLNPLNANNPYVPTSPTQPVTVT